MVEPDFLAAYIWEGSFCLCFTFFLLSSLLVVIVHTCTRS